MQTIKTRYRVTWQTVDSKAANGIHVREVVGEKEAADLFETMSKDPANLNLQLWKLELIRFATEDTEKHQALNPKKGKENND